MVGLLIPALLIAGCVGTPIKNEDVPKPTAPVKEAPKPAVPAEIEATVAPKPYPQIEAGGHTAPVNPCLTPDARFRTEMAPNLGVTL
ncbi:hypothetical protein [Endothiovibrio diazotrophicus]